MIPSSSASAGCWRGLVLIFAGSGNADPFERHPGALWGAECSLQEQGAAGAPQVSLGAGKVTVIALCDLADKR